MGGIDLRSDAREGTLMNMKTSRVVGSVISAALVIAAASFGASSSRAEGGAPRYEADLSWPKPLPDRWVVGGLGGVCVDAQDHVLILNRQGLVEGELNAGHLAPPMIEFDPAGNVVNSWGDLNLLEVPSEEQKLGAIASRLHSCRFDKDNNVWIASSPSGMIQKYTHDGSKLLQQIGKRGVFDSSDGTVKGKPLNSDAARFFMPSSIFVDRQNGDVYVSDGESRNGNRRVAVMDASGNFLRQWQPQGMDTVHCMTIADDGMVYVCNRENARLQLYDKMGTFKKSIELPWKPYTAPVDGKVKQSGGATVALEFSHDAGQSLMFIVNQNNSQIDIVDRQSGKPLSSFGQIGKLAGQFDQPHGIATDSKSNVYVAENRGRRIHKFKRVDE
jgi:DNA-binding beta-propeller fold protein YncE